MKELTEHRAQLLAAFFVDVMGWSERGLMKVLEQCAQDDARTVALALTRISLDDHMGGPGILPQHGQHWRDTETATRPHRVLCEHGHPVDTNVGNATTSSLCEQCIPRRQPPAVDWRAEYQATKAEQAPATRQALTGRNQP